MSRLCGGLAGLRRLRRSSSTGGRDAGRGLGALYQQIKVVLVG